MFATEGTALVIEIIIGICTILSGIAYGIKWMVKHYLSELKPNSGSSMRDEIKDIKKEMYDIKERQNEADMVRRDMDKKLDKMYVILIDYISNKK
jgi:hypothetical protein